MGGNTDLMQKDTKPQEKIIKPCTPRPYRANVLIEDLKKKLNLLCHACFRYPVLMLKTYLKPY